MRWPAALAMLLAFAAAAAGQAPVNVTGTIVDTHGLKYVGSKVTFTLVTAGGSPPSLTPCTNNTAGCPFGTTSFPTTTTIGTGVAFSDGTFSVALVPNANILPAGSTYTVTISSSQATTAPPFGTGPQFCTLTGITITGAVDLSSAINPCPALTVPFGGTSTGCNVAGLLDTWVVWIHPAATCDGSANFTWQDTPHVLQVGDNSNTVGTGTNLALLAGHGISVTTTLGNIVGLYVLSGSSGRTGTANQVFNRNNSSPGAIEDLAVIGEGNLLGASSAGESNDHILGSFNTVDTPGTSNTQNPSIKIVGDLNQCDQCNQVSIVGFNNTIGNLGSGGVASPGSVLGISNGVAATSTDTAAHFQAVGESNTISNGSTDAFTYGLLNTLSSVGNHFVYGFDNMVSNSSGGDLAVYGQSNTASGIGTGGPLGANDSTISGAIDTMTTVNQGYIGGLGDTLSSCTYCGILGSNVSISTTDALGIGWNVSGPTAPQILMVGGVGATTPSVEYRFVIQNAGVTGTSQNHIAKLTGAPSTAVTPLTTDTDGFVGIVVAGAGTTLQASIAFSGTPSCTFDGATTSGDYVQESTTTAGDCHDAGASFPASGQVLGRVLSTNAGAGTYQILLFSPSR